MFEGLARLILGRRWLSAAVMVAVVLGVMSGLRHLVVDFSVTAYFAGDDPAAQHLDDFRDFWGSDDRIAAVVIDSDGESLLTGPRLEEIELLVDDLEELDEVANAVAFTEIPTYRRRLGQNMPVSWRSTLPATEEGAAAWRERLLSDVMIVPSLLSEEGTHASVLVELDGNVDDVLVVQEMIAAVRGVVEAHNGEDGLNLTMGGVPTLRSVVGEMVLSEQVKLVGISFMLMGLVLMVMFRRTWGVVIPLTAAAIPAVALFGFMGHVGEPLGLLNQSLFTLIPVIAIADAIHMVSRFNEERGRSGRDGEKRPSIVRAISHVGAACFLTSATTAVGFASLNVAKMPILRSFGQFAAVGIVFAFLSVVVIVPLMLSFSSDSASEGGSAGPAGKEGSIVGRFLEWCGREAVERPWRLIAGSALVAAISFGFGLKVVVDNHLAELAPKGSEVLDTNRVLDEELGGMIGIQFDLLGEPGVFHREETLRALHEVELQLGEDPIARMVQGPGGAIAYGSFTLGGPVRVPSQEIVDRVLSRHGDGALSRVIGPEGGRGLINLSSRDPGALAFDEATDRMLPLVEEAVAPFGVEVVPTGTSWVAYRGINAIAEDLRASLFIAFLIVTLLVGLLFRSVRLALISIPPNALPLLMGYGFMGMVGLELEPPTAVVFTLALGIAVDDTIHLLARYREERRRGVPPKAATSEALRRCGVAVTVTSLLLTMGFWVNTLSGFPTTVALGSLGAVVIASAWICDLLLLPPLLVLFGEKSED